MPGSFNSGIGRAIDPRYPSNLFVLIAAPLAGVAWMTWKLASEGDWSIALTGALVAAIATFLAWAIARELDPDRPWTAGVAAVLAAAVFGAGAPSLLVSGAILLAVRITVRSTGLAPRMTDLAVVAGFGAVVGTSDPGLAAGALLGAVLVIDRFLPGGAAAASLPIGVVGVAAAAAAAAAWGTLIPAPGLPHGPEWVIVGVAAAGLAAVARPGSVEALGDYRREPLPPGRVRLGRLLAVAGAGLTFIWLGGEGLTSGSAVWASLAAAALPGRPGRALRRVN
ncbi:MAG: hypothetical protein KKE89_05745 [Actinobacteria bacterium]|nr:hypothetical protein [Actinomycetota bacterium]